MAELTPTPRTRVKRLPQRGSYDREVLNAILDEGFLCHVAFLYEGQARVIPTIYARGGDFLYLHGARANRMLNSMIEPGHDACLSVTHVDALVLARSAFHHSVNYRSAVVYGQAEEVTDPDEKLEALTGAGLVDAKVVWSEHNMALYHARANGSRAAAL